MGTVSFRCTPNEEARIKKLASQSGTTISQYLYAIVFPQGQLNLIDRIDIENHLEIITKYLIENQKSNAMLLNIIYQFMMENIGHEEAKAIVERVKNFVEQESNNE